MSVLKQFMTTIIILWVVGIIGIIAFFKLVSLSNPDRFPKTERGNSYATVSKADKLEDRRWRALSMLESTDRDTARGEAGEVSRYQILPELWKRYSAQGWSPHNQLQAQAVGKAIMRDRISEFKRQYNREPNNCQWAWLWHCPAVILSSGNNNRTRHTTEEEINYGAQFDNLVQALQ